MANCLLSRKPTYGKAIYDLGTGTSFNVKNILTSLGVSQPDSFYAGLTANDFYVSTVDGKWSSGGDFSDYVFIWMSSSFTKTYKNPTLSCYYSIHAENNHGGGGLWATASVHVYLIA